MKKKKQSRRQAVINEVFAYLNDHYWDSLQDEQHMILLHLQACKEQLERKHREGVQ